MKKAASKLLSVLLALTMLAGLLPGKALAAGEGYQFGTLQYFSKMTKEYTGDTYYYTDQWFQGDPSVRNDSLALVSAQLATSVTEDPANSVAFLKKLGFYDAKAVGFESTKTDDCAYVVGTKIIGKKKLMAVAFQGTNYGDKGWQQNVTVNGSGSYGLDHAAFSAAAKAFVDDYSQQEKSPIFSGSPARAGAARWPTWLRPIFWIRRMLLRSSAIPLNLRPLQRAKMPMRTNTRASRTTSATMIRFLCSPCGA